LKPIKDHLVRISVRHIWLYAFLVIFASCNQKSTRKDTGEYSDEYLAVQTQADKIWAQNNIDGSMHFMDSAFRRLPNPTINDRFRFYAFNYLYYQKLKFNFDKGLLYADSMLAMASIQ
jgi:two-component system sensor histidine kinase VicK